LKDFYADIQALYLPLLQYRSDSETNKRLIKALQQWTLEQRRSAGTWTLLKIFALYFLKKYLTDL
jgi:hypothetical protein